MNAFHVFRRFEAELWQHWLTTPTRAAALKAAAVAHGQGRCYVAVVESTVEVRRLKRSSRLPTGRTIRELRPQSGRG